MNKQSMNGSPTDSAPMSPQEYRRQINACQLAGLNGLATVLCKWYAEDWPNEPQPTAQAERTRSKDSHNPFPARQGGGA